jgi:hypothetical protein
MRVYYSDDDVEVTSSAICVGTQYYTLDRLEQIWRSGGTLAHRRILVGVGVLLGAVTIRLATSWVWWMGGLRGWLQRWLSGGLATLILASVLALTVAVLGVFAVEAVLRAVEDIRGYGRHHELWASIDGGAVLVWRTNDAARFGKVCRALVRARDVQVLGR